MLLGHLGIDQYGEKYILGERPRKDLLEQLGRKSAHKMYVDSKTTGKARHCGYVIGNLWVTIYEVHGWHDEAGK